MPALTAAAALPDRIDDALARFEFRAATDAIWQVVLAGNRTLEHERPWELGRRPNDPVIRARLNTVLAALVHTCRILAEQCTPFISDGAARLSGKSAPAPSLGRSAHHSPARHQHTESHHQRLMRDRIRTRSEDRQQLYQAPSNVALDHIEQDLATQTGEGPLTRRYVFRRLLASPDDPTTRLNLPSRTKHSRRLSFAPQFIPRRDLERS